MRRVALVVGMALGCSVFATPAPANACGGTFCDGGATPVAQTGETILFVMGEDSTAAHIQIAYDPETDADAFAWVVPLLAVPEFSVGSQALFDALLAGTVPAYGFTSSFDACGEDEGGGAGGDSNGGGVKLDLGGGEDGPDVVLTQTVGAFDITVLSGGTAAEVMQWLGDNGYTQDPAAEPILGEYLDEGYLFAAFKLTHGADTSEIHPVVLEFATAEACVPLRLTRIAAVEELEVRAFFLADGRVVPQNFRHVLVNPLVLDWPNRAANYRDVITLAVDAEEAEGKAFVTEYAGPSAVVPSAGLSSPDWDASVFAGLDVLEVVTTLAAQGLMACFDGGADASCVEQIAVLRGLLLQYLPPPTGVAPEAFWGCLSCYADEIDAAAWDGPAFAAALQERVVGPAANAAAILEAYPYLTRMYTTISPAEMTEDPFFWVNADLPDVDRTGEIATQRRLCNQDALWTLPDGREVYVPAGESWPSFDGEMPYEEEVAQMPPAGAPMALSDRRGEIAAQLEAWNCGHGWPAPACGGGGAGESSGDGTTAGGAAVDGGANGCGCATGGDRGGWWVFGLMVLGLGRRAALVRSPPGSPARLGGSRLRHRDARWPRRDLRPRR